MERLSGKRALVTGATGGIGEATAKRFLQEGAAVMLVGRSEEKLGLTRDRLAAVGKVDTFAGEAGDEAAVAGAVAATVKSFGGLDVLVANAGTEGNAGPLDVQTLENWETVLRTNVIGVWLAMKYGVAAMKKGKGGSIIGISSVAGVIGFPGLTPYVASKHAVYGLVKTAALELGEAGIRVNAIGPGPIDNRMMQSLVEQMMPGDPSGLRTGIEGMVAMKRYGTSEEIANLALFLASDEASYCTGGMYLADGGFTAA